ncbi:MAG TPA: hypothetical protein VFF09_05425 [archaeon]|nr:hypothetical protein [archaeon]
MNVAELQEELEIIRRLPPDRAEKALNARIELRKGMQMEIEKLSRRTKNVSGEERKKINEKIKEFKADGALNNKIIEEIKKHRGMNGPRRMKERGTWKRQRK